MLNILIINKLGVKMNYEKIITNVKKTFAKVYIDPVQDHGLPDLEKKYPNLIKSLFNLALSIFEGKYGEGIKSTIREIDPYKNAGLILTLLIMDVCQKYPYDQLRTNVDNLNIPNALWMKYHSLTLPEIEKLLSEREEVDLSLVNMTKHEVQAIAHLFKYYLENFESPSHVTIDLFIQMDQVDHAITTAMSLKNPNESAKACAHIIDQLLKLNKIEPAIKICYQIPKDSERKKSAIKIASIIEKTSFKLALDFISELKDIHEREFVSRELSLSLAKNGQIKNALEMAETITNLDTKFFLQSNFVSILVKMGKFEDAQRLIAKIPDPLYHVDAIAAYVRGLVDADRIEDATAWIFDLKDEKDRIFAARILENCLIAAHKRNALDIIRPLFNLHKHKNQTEVA